MCPNLKEESKTAAKAEEQNRQRTHRRERERETDGGVTLANIPTSSYNVVTFLPQFSIHTHSFVICQAFNDKCPAIFLCAQREKVMRHVETL